MSAPQQDSPETIALLQRARHGDQTAFNELFACHLPPLRQFIEFRLDRRLQGRMDASDILQETQLEAFRRFDDYCERKPMPFHIWLRRNAYERLLNARRDHRAALRSIDREQPLPERSSVLLAHSIKQLFPTPSEALARRENRQCVTQALAELPQQDSEVLLMRHVEGMTHAQIAQVMDIEHATARQRYARALLKLERLLRTKDLLDTH